MVTKKIIKVLQICNFSSGISGVWTRVLEDSREFAKRRIYEVHIFSSNIQEDGTHVKDEETLEGIKIKRFPVRRKLGYALWFDFEEEAIKLNPDIIICHGLRKPYLNKVINISKKIGAKCYLVTHAPFIDKDLRNLKLNLLIKLYDLFYGKKVMNSFDKVIAICKWEENILIKLGCDSNRILYIPNALSNLFFEQKKEKEKKKIIYLGRMHPVKKIELLIRAFKEINLEGYTLEVISSKNGSYYHKLYKIKNNRISFLNPIYELKKKIKIIDSAEMLVLPSRKESLPFGIIEAMSRGKIVIATDTKGGKELIEDGKNGFLFEIGNKYQLKLILEKVNIMSKEEKEKIRSGAMKSSEQFNLKNVLIKWENLFNEIKR